MSLQGLLLYALREEWSLIQLITEWEVGSSLDRSWHHVHMQLPLTLVGLYVSFFYREEMNVLSLGEEAALCLGVEVGKVRWRLFVSVALMVGGTTAALGSLPFYGLILPHIVRSLFGPNLKYVLPLSALYGATALLWLDHLLRRWELGMVPLGNLAAIIGGVTLLFLSLGKSTRHELFSSY